MSIPPSKRRRLEDGSYNSDEPLGAQSLPVGFLPEDFDGSPVDGEQYLALVRKEAAEAPNIFFASHNPYAAPDIAIGTKEGLANEGSLLNASSSNADLPKMEEQLLVPTMEWRKKFLQQYRNMRGALSNPPTDKVPNPIGRLPKPSNVVGWYKWIHGREPPQDQQSGARNQNPIDVEWHIREPTATELLRLTTDHILGLLEAFPYWLTYKVELPEPKDDREAEGAWVSKSGDRVMQPLHERWLFALLTKLDTRLLSEQISTLRTLARSCIATIALGRLRRKALKSLKKKSTTSIPTRLEDGGAEPLSGPKGEEGEGEAPGPAEEFNEFEYRKELLWDEAGAWMIVTIIAGIWGQSDLWDDAMTDLRRVT